QCKREDDDQWNDDAQQNRHQRDGGRQDGVATAGPQQARIQGPAGETDDEGGEYWYQEADEEEHTGGQYHHQQRADDRDVTEYWAHLVEYSWRMTKSA